LKRNKTNLTQKKKPNHKGWNWKTISIKKMIATKNNNQKNEDHIWYTNILSIDEIQR